MTRNHVLEAKKNLYFHVIKDHVLSTRPPARSTDYYYFIFFGGGEANCFASGCSNFCSLILFTGESTKTLF